VVSTQETRETAIPLSEYKDIEFLPKIDDGYVEPIGLFFAREKHDKTIRSNLEALLMGMAADISTDTNAEQSLNGIVGFAFDDAIDNLSESSAPVATPVEPETAAAAAAAANLQTIVAGFSRI
jgi:hypothetical protein